MCITDETQCRADIAAFVILTFGMSDIRFILPVVAYSKGSKRGECRHVIVSRSRF